MPAHADDKLPAATFESTRTGRVYAQLFVRDSLNIARTAEDLLPSLSAYAGLGISDESAEWTENAEARLGVSFSLPFKKPREKAKLELARIDQQKNELSKSSLRGTFAVRLAQLQSSVESQRKAVELAEQRAALAESIYAAESEDYLYGRNSLNDLIQALNTLQNNRLLTINAKIDLATSQLDALELIDELIIETEIDSLR